MESYWFSIKDEAEENRIVTLEPGVHTLGRSSSADIIVESRNVSGKHLSVAVGPQGTAITDLGSTNGTFVNKRRVSTATLKDGDRIEIADCRITFHMGKKEDRTAVFPLPSNRESMDVFAASLVQKASLNPLEAQMFSAEWSSMRRSSQLLDSIHSLLPRILSITDKKELTGILLKEISGLMELDIVGMYVNDDDTFFVWKDGSLNEEKSAGIVSESVLKHVVEKKQPVVLEQAGEGSDISQFKSLMRFKVQSLLCFPVCTRNSKVVAAIYCVSRQLEKIKTIEKDRLFLSVCSSMVSIAMENLSLIALCEQRARDTERHTQEMRFTPVISRLAQERENLSLKLGKSLSGAMFGIDLPANSSFRDFIIKAARTDIPVLLTGETGTGKNVAARAIHDSSGIKGRFVTVDCTTIPNELIESELFGYEKGAFTGANTKKQGKVSLAEGGTLLLDEIGEIPIGLQAKLLRLLSSGEFEALGSTNTHKIRMKLIAATNRDLRSAVAKNLFREDLFFRLNVLKFEIPSLRSNPMFIVPLAEHFLARYAAQLNPEVKSISSAAVKILKEHRWPGNIRELENTIMRALVNCQGTVLEPDNLEILEMCSLDSAKDVDIAGPGNDDSGLDLKNAREKLDQRYISYALEKTGGNVSKAARILRISRNALMELIKKYSLSGVGDTDE